MIIKKNPKKEKTFWDFLYIRHFIQTVYFKDIFENFIKNIIQQLNTNKSFKKS